MTPPPQIVFFGIDLVHLIQTGGLPLLLAIVFSETGLYFGCFLPGDSLLVAAGFAASIHVIPLPLTLVAVPLAAICGDQLNYFFGLRMGEALYRRPESRLFKRKHLLDTRAFFDEKGPVALILARFMPFARTFAPAVAGIGQMRYRRFLTYSVLGGILWVWSMALIGYSFGQIPFVQKHIEKAILVVILVSVSPVLIHWLKGRRAAAVSTPKSH